MSYVEIETGRYIKRWAFWNPATWSIPKLYWDAWSQEQRLHAICRQLEKVIKYADYLGVNVDDIAARLKAIEEGQLDPIIEAAIENWFEENEPEIVQRLETAEADIASIFDAIGTGFSAENTISENISRIDASLLVCVDDYGAIGDGVTDSTAAIQQCIDENPNTCITFKRGTYIISDTIMLNGDNESVSIDLNGCIVLWNGNVNTYEEGNAFALIPDSQGICANPPVMFAVRNREEFNDVPPYNQTFIINGTIDGDMKAGICIQNVAFLSHFNNLRIQNFMYCGILNGTLDGQTYDYYNNVTSQFGRSTQVAISDCYFTRRGDCAYDENTSAIHITYPDNNIDNIVTNRSEYGLTIRIGGNSVSNSHITGEYPMDNIPDYDQYKSAGVRLWPYSSGATEINIFDNIYFNAVKRAFYTYHDTTQNITLSNFRTICSNSHLTFYSTAMWFTDMIDMTWFGGMWFGTIHTVNCAILIGNNATVQVHETPVTPSLFLARTSETQIANLGAPHENQYLHSADFLCNGEFNPISSAQQPYTANTYKRIARLVTTAPINTNFIPGAINYGLFNENGTLYHTGTFVRNNNTYASSNNAELGTTGMKLYIKNEGYYQIGNFKYYYADLYIYATANFNDTRFMMFEPTTPFVNAYMLPNGQNFNSGKMQNIFTTLNDAIEIF